MKLSEALEKYGDCEVKQELIDLINVKPKTTYDLKEGDKYFCLSPEGEILFYSFRNRKFCKDCFNIGNVFLTKEEAEQHKQKLEVEAILRKYSHEFSEKEWKDDCISKIYIFYDWDSVSIETDYCCTWKMQGTIHFKNKDDANRAIAEVGKDRLAKYLKAN